MKPYQEFEGKNVTKAVQAACAQFGIKEKDLKYDVISEGSTGIFGLVGVKKAKIRVQTPEKKRDYRSERTEGAVSLVDEAFKVGKTEEPVRQEKPAFKESDEPIVEKTIEEAPAPKEIVEPIEISEEMVEIGRVALGRIVDLITEDATVVGVIEDGSIQYEIDGGNSAVLIGKRGQTLESMQYIVEKIVNKKSEQRIRIQIDIEGYLEQRKESLKNLAEKLADKAKRYGKPMTISQMTAHDRRIVHLTLKDDKGVRTQSVGDGYYRRLIIFPKKSRYKRSGYRNKRKE